MLAGLEAGAAASREAVRELEPEEAGLADELRAGRRRAADAALLADEAAVDRVLRVEAHLTRQLEATLALFGRLAGRPTVGLGVAGLGRAGGGGFVSFPGPPCPAGGIGPSIAHA